MEYTQGTMGRIFVVRIDHGDNVLDSIQELAKKEQIRAAYFMMIGAVGSSKLVTGPKEKCIPPDVEWTEFSDARELVGAGNIAWMDNEPKIHLHAAIGGTAGVIMGCVRDNTEAFMVVEVVIFEIDGVDIVRKFNETVGFNQMKFASG